MQNALSVYLQTIEGLLEDSEIEKAIQVMMDLDDKFQAGIRRDIIQQSSNFKSAQKQFQNGLIEAKELRMATAQASNGLLQILEGVPRRIELNNSIKSLNTYQFNVPDDARLEKIIGGQNNILKINWLEKALQASKAVCRVVCADGSLGTGFLTREGYVYTNNHVIGSADIARTTRIEFNYELDASGAVKNRIAYNLDPTDFSTSTPDKLDFARVKVVDRTDQPLNQWGFVEFDPEAVPTVGDAVTIIQHPKGEDKQIALNANDVLGQYDQYLFYSTDTEPGSSGSPVFNKDWRVVAIHHAGKTDAEGGMVINARGDRRGANRGILFRDIFGFLKTGAVKAGSGTGGNESLQSTANTVPATPAPVDPVPDSRPVATPPVVNTPTATPVSAVPKFVVLYDLSDDAQCKLLNKHLNVLKITKKIQVYNVNDVLAGVDPIAQAHQELASADYLVVLLTVNLLNSPDWFGMAYDALQNGRRIIPIRIGKVDIDDTGFEKLSTLPTLNRTVADFPNPDAAFLDIVGELKKLLPR
jgi:V8-like Glu-specific endopeptidase